MKDDFTPPIKTRTTQELLKIVGNPDGWNPAVVRIAANELNHRNVAPKKIKTAKYLSNKRKGVEEKEKANQGYNILDFLFHPFGTLLELTFSWELKKDGFHKKAKQQRSYRKMIGFIALLGLIYFGLLLLKNKYKMQP